MAMSLIMASASLVSLASCTKNSGVEKAENDALITFVASKPAVDEVTKTGWNNGLKAVTWKAGDKIKVACLRDGQYWQAKSDDAPASGAKIYTSNALEKDASVAEFTMGSSSIFTWTKPGSYQFFSAYPASLFSSADFKNAPEATVTLKASQALSTESFDAGADIMVGRSTTAYAEVIKETTVVPMEFKRMVALSQITFKSLKGAEDGEVVKSITLTAQDDAKIVGSVTLNLLEGTVDGSKGVNSVALKSSDGIALDETGSISAWFSTLEFTATRIKVEIVTDAARYTRDIDLSTNPKTFLRNKRNLLTVNMNSADREDLTSNQPSTVEFGSLGYSTWGETESFSGTTKNEVIQTKDNVQITYTRNGSSLYANSTSIRFYKSNTIKFDAPNGYAMTSVVWGISGGKDDVTTNGGTCTSTTDELSWSGKASTVTFTRPDGATSYITLSSVTVTLESTEGSNPGTPDPVVMVKDVEEATASSAVLAASYSGATENPVEARFEIGLSPETLDRTIHYNEGGLGHPNGSFSVNAESLAAGTTYYYRAVIQVAGKEYYSGVKPFSTSTESTAPPQHWLELPAYTTGDRYFVGHFGEKSSRNYTYLYDKSMYTSLWSAYPLTKSHVSGSASTTTWNFNPQIDQELQINIISNSYGTNYDNSTYSRGHQVPAADRKDDNTRRSQTYYATNQTPQIQNNFNNSIWSNVEGKIRELTEGTDTVYVVTGATFQKKGGNETVKYLTAAKETVQPKTIPVPNYYWKVVLKVKRSGSTITSASTIGFWLDHKVYPSNDFTPYVVSVDTIEQYTGFDFFVNLPDNLETTAESNTSWTAFQGF